MTPHRLEPIVILGPTAGGKTELAARLAQRLPGLDGNPLGGEIVSADSMQIYRHLDVGTAKPSARQRQRCAHHLIDIVEPTERFTVADWLACAQRCIGEIHQRGHQPIIVGGTNLYLKALLEGLMPGPEPDQAFRRSLQPVNSEQLHRRLGEIDSEAAARISAQDRKRIVRALEVHRQTGQTISQRQVHWHDQRSGQREPSKPAQLNTNTNANTNANVNANVNAKAKFIASSDAKAGVNTQTDAEPAAEADDRKSYRRLGLAWDKAALNRRINQRVKAMFYPQTCGFEGPTLIDETRQLMDEGWLGTDQSQQANEAIGYKQCLAALLGEMSQTQAFEKTKIATRRLAKQQRSWLKRFTDVHWLEATDMPVDTLADEAASLIV